MQSDPNVFSFTFRQVAPDTWHIENDGCSSWVLRGRDVSMMIDTGYGEHDVRAWAEQTLGFPIRAAINTHGHFDHSGGNFLFEHAYMSRDAEPGAMTPYPSFGDRTVEEYPIIHVNDGFRIDIGDRELQIYGIASHSPGDIAILDTRERILFVGDCGGDHVMLIHQIEDPQPSIAAYAGHIRRLLADRDRFDWIANGHGMELMDASILEGCLANAEHILAGNEGDPMTPPPMDPNRPRYAKGPRPGDFRLVLPAFKRLSRHAGTTIGYDVRYVHGAEKSAAGC